METRIYVYDKINNANAMFMPGTGEGGDILFTTPFVLDTLCFDCVEHDANFDFRQPKENYDVSIYPF